MTRLACALLACAALFAEGCGDACGRGRCGDGKCVSVLGRTFDYSDLGSWNDQVYPRTDNEWWCLVPCAGAACAGPPPCPAGRLVDPTDEGRSVCAGASTVNVEYYLANPKVQTVVNGCVDVSSYPLLNSAYQTVQTCTLGQPACSLGARAPGSALPIILEWNGQVMNILSLNDLKPATIGSVLPQGVSLRIYVGVTCK